MQQVRIVRKGRKANDRWLPEHREVLPLDPRDPDIARVKELNKSGNVNGDRSGCGTTQRAGGTPEVKNGYESRRTNDLLMEGWAQDERAAGVVRRRASW
jgi:hypothetical protein